MKRSYVKPMAKVECFAANEYVSACRNGAGEQLFTFTCNAGCDENGDPIKGKPDGINLTKSIWMVKTDSGETIASRYITAGAFGSCGATHTTVAASEFETGYMDNQATAQQEHINVVIWRGDGNVHCTPELLTNILNNPSHS